MLSLIRRYQLNRAVRQYIFELGPALRRRYSGLDQYTVLQIRETARCQGVNLRYLHYAVALYRHEQSENTRGLFQLDQAQLDQLREEIAEALFEGDVHYRATEVLALSRVAGWKGGPAPDWWSNHFGKTSL